MPFQRMGALQTGSTQSQEFAIYGFQGGLNVKDLPQMLPDGDLPIAQDGYLTQSGGFQLRNGMTPFGPSLGTGPVYLARFFQDVINGVPQTTEVVQLIAQVASSLYNVTSTTKTLIGIIGPPQKAITTARFQNPNDPNFTGGLTDCLAICTGSAGPYVWDGTNFYHPAGWNAALGAQWCALVNGILWFGGIPATPNQIFGTGDGITASMESLPAYRNFVFSSPVVGLCASGTGAQAALIAGLNDGVAILSGTGPSNFYLQETPFADAVTSGHTMISYDGTIFFLGRSAVYAFGLGSIPTQISQKVEPWILNRPYTSSPIYPGFPMVFNRQLSWAQVYNNRLHIGYSSNSPARTPDTMLVYDLILQGWTVLRPAPGCASMILLDAPTDPVPYTALVGGTDGQIYTWDVETSDTDPVTDNGVAVLAQFQTKFFKVGVPGTTKALQRFYPEFYIAGTFNANFLLNTNYSSTGITNTLSLPYQSFFGIWDVSAWDNADWAIGDTKQFVSFNAPTTRVDYPGTQAESFAFGLQMTTSLAPWIFAGGSGVYNQQGRV